MKKTQASKLAKYCAIIYIIAFFAINWSDVSWIFNYRTVWGLIDDFFTPYSKTEASTFFVNHAPQNQDSAVHFFYSDKNNILEIEKIGILVPVIFSQTTDPALILKDLDKGVVYYPGSVVPGESGQIIVLGHSAPPNWPKIKHDWVFSDLEKLSSGDKINIYLDFKKYSFTVKKTTILEKGQDISPENIKPGESSLVLISCWPPGKDLQRITVQAEID